MKQFHPEKGTVFSNPVIWIALDIPEKRSIRYQFFISVQRIKLIPDFFMFITKAHQL